MTSEARTLTPPAGIAPAALASYLADVLGGPVSLLSVRPLGGGDGASVDPKGFGYGVPLEVRCAVAGQVRDLVLARTRPAQGFGHDYPADRAWQALYGHPAYNGFPRHARSVDVGLLRESGQIDSVADAVEFFQLVEKVEGTLYWRDLDRLLAAAPGALDEARAEELGCFLAATHAARRDEPTLYQRRIRELVGHGECLMGVLDSYPHPYALLPAADCEALEQAAVSWRWRLRGRAHRLAFTHGDFHPWNLLFREGTDFSVLDRSRGEWGEPADDVAALGVNYLFFALRAAAAGTGGAPGLTRLFRRFLGCYLERSGDGELLDVLPPFLAFRALVIAHPRWYPALTDLVRLRLLGFARRLLGATTFDPEGLHGLLAGLP